MTKTNFIHIEETDFELVINAENIKYVNRIGSNVFVHFTGEQSPLHLRMEAGQALWRLIRASSTTIHRAAVENKNAETL